MLIVAKLQPNAVMLWEAGPVQQARRTVRAYGCWRDNLHKMIDDGPREPG
jgi:hypothetical protein